MVGIPRWEQRLLDVDRENIDYPAADFWSPAHHKVPASPRTIRYVVIHITGGPAVNERNALNTFRSGPASAHYIVNREGRVVQMVREEHLANHVDHMTSRTNRESIGIEHVNPWDPHPRMYPTSEQYRASARLVAWLCRRYGIPLVHNATPHAPGIRGHIEEAPHSSHVSCPNPAWDWATYMGLVTHARGESFEDVIRSVRAGPR